MRGEKVRVSNEVDDMDVLISSDGITGNAHGTKVNIFIGNTFSDECIEIKKEGNKITLSILGEWESYAVLAALQTAIGRYIKKSGVYSMYGSNDPKLYDNVLPLNK
jgi:hypothetical protein